MEWKGKRIVLTGAAGGMGRILASELHRRGARLALVDLNAGAMTELTGSHVVAADLSTAAGCRDAAERCRKLMGGVDILLNLAGINSFAAFEDEPAERIEKMMRVNLMAPMWLTHALLPQMQREGSGHIVNVGSVFGSIGFAYFTTYSASKFGLRGFSEALRRELAGSGIAVSYIAPRAVKTPMNTDAVRRMGEAVKMNMDEPEAVVARIVVAIESGKKDAYFGFPESLFVRVNALLPRLVDGALAAQNQIARSFAKGEK